MHNLHRAAVFTFALGLLLGSRASASLGQSPANAAKPDAAPGYSLLISGEIEPDFAPTVGRLAALFYESYPKLVERFEHPQKPAPRQIRLVFEHGLKVPAHCRGDVVTVSVDWMRRNPNDLGLLTHELTHAVQAYPSAEPGWFTEGLADYARKLYGPKDQPGWSLPTQLTEKQSYKDSYRTTARFLVWLEEKHPGAVDKLHRRMQDRAYTPDDWKTFTGSTVDELWSACVRELGR